MDVLFRLKSQVGRMKTEMDHFRNTWTRHNQWIKQHHAEIKEQCASTWGHDGRDFYTRLRAIDECLAKRTKFLDLHGNRRKFEPVVNLNITKPAGRNFGIFARNFVESLVDAENAMLEKDLAVRTMENAVNARYSKLLSLWAPLFAHIESEKLALDCGGITEMQKARIELERRREVEGYDDTELAKAEEYYARLQRQADFRLGRIQRCIDGLARIMANLGIHVPRQTQIQEYFKPLRPE